MYTCACVCVWKYVTMHTRSTSNKYRYTHTSSFEIAHRSIELCSLQATGYIYIYMIDMIWYVMTRYNMMWHVCLYQYGLEWCPCIECIARSVNIVHLAQRSIMFFFWVIRRCCLTSHASPAMPPPIRYKPPLPVRFKALAVHLLY